jgi:MFS family permease
MTTGSEHKALNESQRLMVSDMLEEARQEVGHADAKASILLAGLGVAAGAVAAALLAGDWTPSELEDRWCGVWWAGATLGGLAVLSLGAALVPRIKTTVPGPTVGYFNDVAVLGELGAVREAIAKVNPDERSLAQLVAVSIIARRKYLWLRRGMVLAALGIALMVAAALVGR